MFGTYSAILYMALTMQKGPTRDLAKLLAIFLIAASFGISSLTANRIATLVWLVVALLFLVRRHQLELRDGPTRAKRNTGGPASGVVGNGVRFRGPARLIW